MATTLPVLLLLVAAAAGADVQAGAQQAACPPPPSGSSKTAAQRLHHALFCGYDRLVLPVADPDKNIDITVTAWIHSLSVNEYYGKTLDLNVWLLMMWTDDYLAWDPSVYEGISELRPPADKIWTPSFIMNTPRSAPTLEMHRPSEVCALDKKGNVECMWPASFSLECRLRYARWPFDTQMCQFILFAVNDNTSRMHITLENASLTSWMIENPEWKLESAQAYVQYVRMPPSQAGSMMPTLNFTLVIQRRPAVYLAAITVPAFGAALMTLLPYLLQPMLPQRSLLVAAGVLAHLYMLQLLSNVIYGVAGAVVPSIVLLYRDSMALCTLSLVVSVLHRWLQTTSPEPPAILKDTSSRLFDFWSRNLTFMRLQTQDSPPQPETPIEDFWQRWTSAMDGCLLAISLLAYAILLLRFLP